MTKNKYRLFTIMLCMCIWWNYVVFSYADETNENHHDEESYTSIVEDFNPIVGGDENNIDEYLMSLLEIPLNRDELVASKEQNLYNRKSAKKALSPTSVKYQGKYKNIEWKIYDNGLLTISGDGEFKTKNPSKERVVVPPWYDYVDEIRSARVDLKGTQDFSEMFWKCSNLEDVVFINTQVLYPITMQGMFQGCYSLSNIEWGAIDTRNLTDTMSMFGYCRSLGTIDLSGFDTSKVQDMSYMFNGCNATKTINLDGKFSTKSVVNMQSMFMACFDLEELDLINFDTGNVENMNAMFASCQSLLELTFRKSFITSNVKDMSYMFSMCMNIAELNLMNFDCKSLAKGTTSTTNMIDFCYRLKKVNPPNNMGDSEIKLYVDSNNGSVWGWHEEGKTEEIKYISKSNSNSTYVRYCKNDYWDKFSNQEEYFAPNDIENYYFITESDLTRLISKLPESEKINILGNKQSNYYRTIDDSYGETKVLPSDMIPWDGSCYGMSCWSALQNNNWVTLPTGLKGVDLSYDIESKINYYQFQQKLTTNYTLSEYVLSLTDADKIPLLLEALRKNKSLISYEWIQKELDASTGEINDVYQSHCVCGIALRYVAHNEKTYSGIDVSKYKYCAIVYDPATIDVSSHSDYNIYFNDDGTYYIPKRDLKNENSNIKRIVADKDYINAIDYYTGEPSSKIVSSPKSNTFLRVPIGNQYSVNWTDGQIIIDENGGVISNDQNVSVIYEDADSEHLSKTITICLPDSDDYMISSPNDYDVYFLKGTYTVYASVISGGDITFKNNGNTYIKSLEKADKTVLWGINEGEMGNQWNYIYSSSSCGQNMSVELIGDKVIVEGDDLTGTNVRLTDVLEDDLEPIKLGNNLKKAVFTKEGERIVIDYDENAITDDYNNDEHNNDKDKNTHIIDDAKVSFEITDIWEGGYNALIRIENTSEENIDNWTLAFDYDGEISNVWNAEILSHDGSKYTIKNVGWNQDIAPGQTIEIGLSGQENFVSEPTDYSLISVLNEGNTNDFSISIQIYDDWGSGCNGNMTITNNSDTTIEDWVLEFDFDAELTSIWNAEIVSHEGAHYIIKNAQHNSNIEPGQSVSVGFNGGEGAGSTELRGYKLYSYGL